MRCRRGHDAIKWQQQHFKQLELWYLQFDALATRMMEFAVRYSF
jgi:hypothetical protein